MTRNMGSLDRIFRVIVGLLLILVPFTGWFGLGPADGAALSYWHWLAVAVGAVFLVTGLAGNCPLYRLFGIRTCSTD